MFRRRPLVVAIGHIGNQDLGLCIFALKDPNSGTL